MKEKESLVFLVNTDKGLAFSKETKTKFYLEESSFSKIKKKNGQLNHASSKTKKRKNIMMRYKNGTIRKSWKNGFIRHTESKF